MYGVRGLRLGFCFLVLVGAWALDDPPALPFSPHRHTSHEGGGTAATTHELHVHLQLDSTGRPYSVQDGAWWGARAGGCRVKYSNQFQYTATPTALYQLRS
jgi:hypothetical protein